MSEWMSDLLSTEEEIKLDLCWGSFEVWPSCSFRCSVESFSGLFFPKKTYKEAVHIGEGAFVDVLVTHVAAPDEIYVQKVWNIVSMKWLLIEWQSSRLGKKKGWGVGRG